MGLDMHIFASRTSSTDEFHDILSEIEKDEDYLYEINHDEVVVYWRKHANLHGWFCQRKHLNPTGREAYSRILVTMDMIQQLELDVYNDCLPETTGGFIGKSLHSGDDDYCEQLTYDLDAIEKIKDYLEDECIVWYEAS